MQAEGALPTRRSLVARLKRWDDRESWQEFFERYWKLIYGVAIRSGLNDSEAQDVVQETVASVARQMPNFRYDPAVGSFKSWLLLITRRRILDHLRKRYRRIRVIEPRLGETPRTARMERVPDPASAVPDQIWEEEWQRQVLAKAIAELKRQVDAKQFQVFDCYVLKEWPVKDVATTFGVTANQVYLIKHRLSALLAGHVKKLGDTM